jgi:ubiquinone/menaquinone biosynthesis C-methylase UbiE
MIIRKIRTFIRQCIFVSLIMLSKIFHHLKRILWKTYYNGAAVLIEDDQFIFMNLGYAALDSNETQGRPEDPAQLHRFSEQLYEHVAGGADLQGKDVLEVGCGRGGGSAYIQRRFQPKSLISIDIAEKNIDRCKDRFSDTGIVFQQADALALPSKDSSFDVIINIESSHCYPSREEFFQEVARCLRPGGIFLYADLVWPILDNISFQKLRKMLVNTGFISLRSEDITGNVLKSRDILSESTLFNKSLERWMDKIIAKGISDIDSYKRTIFLKGTRNYNRMKKGEISYWTWVLQNP